MKRTLARGLLALAAVLIAIATALGAIASHALDATLDVDALGSFETAVRYQFVHALGLAIVAVHAERQAQSKLLGLVAGLLVIGILCFCGGVYASSLDGPGWLAGLAPAGGMALIAGWLLFAVAVCIAQATAARH
jgi:uncharacterized membrane protein YgdD (TMEM256/DUF423 family)